MPIATEKIEEIRQAVDVLQVVGRTVALRKRGSRWIGLCPFHGEKTPSFTITPEKGLFYCFGCRAGGDIFAFVMRQEGIEFQEAVQRLAEEAGLKVALGSPERQKKRQQKKELAQINAYAQAFFEHALWNSPSDGDSKHSARAYLAQRGISEEEARDWGLGYGGKAHALLAYLDAKKVPRSLAVQAGILGERGHRSLFDGRLTFPISDRQKRLAGFGGRRLGDGDEPKYVNSRESPLFVKGSLLFGLPKAHEAIMRSQRIVLVEGYMDVLACHRAGVREAVAPLGTAFTGEHVVACKKWAKEVVLLFDGDAAGQKAVRDAGIQLLGGGIRALWAALPEGEDPDTLLSCSGKEALRRLVDEASPLLQAMIETQVRRGDSIEEKADAARSIAPMMLAMPPGIERELYVARLADRIGVAPEQLIGHLRSLVAPRNRSRTPPSQPTTSNSPRHRSPPHPEKQVFPSQPQLWELRALKELLLYPQLRRKFGELLSLASPPMHDLLRALAATDKPSVPELSLEEKRERDQEGTLEEILNDFLQDKRWVKELVAAATTCFEEDLSFSDMDERATQTMEDVRCRMERARLESERKKKTVELKDRAERGEDTEELFREIQSLTRRTRQLKGQQDVMV